MLRRTEHIHIGGKENRVQPEQRILQAVNRHLLQSRSRKRFRNPPDDLRNITIGQYGIRQFPGGSQARFHCVSYLLLRIFPHILQNQSPQFTQETRYFPGRYPGILRQAVIPGTQRLKRSAVLRLCPCDHQSHLKCRHTGFKSRILHSLHNQKTGPYLVRVLCHGSNTLQNLLQLPCRIFRPAGGKLPYLRVNCCRFPVRPLILPGIRRSFLCLYNQPVQFPYHLVRTL